MTKLKIFKELLTYRYLLSLVGIMWLVPIIVVFFVFEISTESMFVFIVGFFSTYVCASKYCLGLPNSAILVNIIHEALNNRNVRVSFGFWLFVFAMGLWATILTISNYASPFESSPRSATLSEVYYHLGGEFGVTLLILNAFAVHFCWLFVQLWSLHFLLNSAINPKNQQRKYPYMLVEIGGLLTNNKDWRVFVFFAFLLLVASFAGLYSLVNPILADIVKSFLHFALFVYSACVAIEEMGIGQHKKSEDKVTSYVSSTANN